MKQCTKCLFFGPFTQFYKQAKNSKDGYQSHCKDCDNKRVAIRKAKHPEKTKEIQAVSDKNKYIKQKVAILARNKRWKSENPVKMQAIDARRRAAKLHRTPAWLTEDDHWMMEQAYDIAQKRTLLFGFPWHVDHVIPLQGKLVSGLHVPHNMRVVSATENLRKGNIFEIEPGYLGSKRS
jgi:hypothetical protein